MTLPRAAKETTPQIVVILALPRGMTIKDFVGGFSDYIPKLVGGSPSGNALDQHFFSCMARFSDGGRTPPHIVSLYDSPPLLPSGSVLYCIHGHGMPDGPIINIDESEDIGPDELREQFSKFLARTSTTGKHQVFLDSCFAEPPMVDAIKTAIRESPLPLQWKGPAVLGCSGVSVVHPDPRIPIVQFDHDYILKPMSMQSALEDSHPDEVVRAQAAIRRLTSVPRSLDHGRRIDLLWEVSSIVGRLQESIFNKFIAAAYVRGLLHEERFTLMPGAWCSSERLPKLSEPLRLLATRDASGIGTAEVSTCFAHMFAHPRYPSWIPTEERRAKGLQASATTPTPPSIPQSRTVPKEEGLEVVGESIRPK